ncbi:MAG: TonB C-terminal domain-containing protein [Byssovorax sp.]
MSREANIPLILWVFTAALFHLVGSQGANEAAQVAQDRAQLRALTQGVRRQLHPADTTVELLSDEAVPTPSPDQPPPDLKDDDKTDDKVEDVPPDKQALVVPPPPKPPPPPKVEEKKPEEKKPEEKKPEEKLAVPVPPPPPVPLAPLPPPDHRLAIKQNVAKDQPDNPNAARIADEANHVDEETMARIRSKDQDDPNPSAGKPFKAGPKDDKGNDDHDKVADSEDKKGNPDHAPGENKPDSTTVKRNNPAPLSPPKMATNGPPPAGGRPGPKMGGPMPAPAAPPPSPGGAGPAAPEVIAGVNGGYTLDPANPGGDGKSRRAGKKRAAQAGTAFVNPVHPSEVGYNRGGGLNLSQQVFENVVGPDKLKAERAADGAARRSAHRGNMEGNKFDRWRAAIENYDPSVKPGNQTALNAARVPFASYINAIHNRIHPIFAEEFLASLDAMPKGTAMAAANLVTHVEIVLSKDQGRVVRLGVTKASGVTAFDVVALDAVNRAQPFGKAPDTIVSPDGNVYLHWEFHRDPFDACSTRNASPFLLASAPPGPPAKPAPPRRPALGAPRDESPVPGPLLPLRGQ